jgi:hypothetical protein
LWPQAPQLSGSITPALQTPWQQIFPRPQAVLSATVVQAPPLQARQGPHPPHWSVPPQPSSAMPQWRPSCAQVVGVQPQTLLVQVLGAVQLPQLSVLPHPSAIAPQFLPWAAQVVGVHVATHVLSWHVWPLAQQAIG